MYSSGSWLAFGKASVGYYLTLILLMALVGCSDSPPATTTSQPPDASKVPQLIEAMDSPSPVARSAAINKLGQIGPPASAALPKLEAMYASADAATKPMLKETIDRIKGVAPPAAQ